MSKNTCPKNICPKCGGIVVAEALCSYGLLYYIRKDGKIGRRLRKFDYGGSGEWMYYCTKCGENFYDWPYGGYSYD